MDKEIRQMLKSYPEFLVIRMKRHFRIVNTKNGDYVVASCSGSDHRGFANLRSDLRKLANGLGYLYRNAL